MVKVLNFLKRDYLIFLLLSFFSPLFFYKLGQSSLISWDEAWYAEISRNIIKSGDLLNLFWNGAPFSDKPPGVMWIQAIFFKALGVSEFSARFFSALSGVFSLYLVYLLGSQLFSKFSGLLSTIALSSAFWFIYRARSGDLDTPLILFYLLSIYLGLIALKKRKAFLLFSLSFAYLAMIKGIVFIFALLPSLLIIFWGNRIYKPKDFLLPLGFLALFFGSWILAQYIKSPDLAAYHFSHSARESSLNANIGNNLIIFKEYLHNGIGRFFWPGVLGVAGAFFLREKSLLILAVFCLFYSVQFLFSPNVGIWHLIPLYPFMILAFFGSIFVFLKKFPRYQLAINVLVLIFTLYISLTQIRQMWYLFIDIPAFVSDDAILSKEAGKYPYPFFIDSAFEPAAVFYSGKEALWHNEYGLPVLFKKNDPFLLIVKQPMLDKLKVDPKDYQILKQDRDKILILYQSYVTK